MRGQVGSSTWLLRRGMPKKEMSKVIESWFTVPGEGSYLLKIGRNVVVVVDVVTVNCRLAAVSGFALPSSSLEV